MTTQEVTQPQTPHEENPIPKDLPKLGSITVGVIVVIGALLLAGLFVVGFIPRHNRIVEADRIASEANEKPVVDITTAKPSDTAGNLVLPADVRAYAETAIYPRANGYLKKPLVDIGDKVKDGQLLVEIDSPELDAQLKEALAAQEQAKANLNKAKADKELAQTTWNRYETLSKTAGAVTPQDVDEKQSQLNQAAAALSAAEANVTAATATVQRLTDLQRFEKVTSPYAGTISARNYDEGALVTASSMTGKELFRLVQADPLRVFINVPQSYAGDVKIGQGATLLLRNYPGKEFSGKIVRSTGAVDPSSRTLRFEVDVANKDGALWPGMYGTVNLPIMHEQPVLHVPSSALVYDAEGTKVATVEDGKIRMKKIEIGRDLGQELEITQGLTGNEQIVANPGERLAEGTDVQIAQKSAEKPTRTAAAGTSLK